MSAFELITSQPWLIIEDDLRVILEIAQRLHNSEGLSPEALVTRHGRPLMGARTVEVRSGVAVVPVVGPIFRYANFFTEISGATSTQVLATDIRTALDDPTIRAIVLDMNSPGGAVAGINELGNLIYEGRKQKRIVAYAGGLMGSAAYWLGSAADEVVADDTAVIGSIGAIATFTDTKARDERQGVRTIDIISSQSPNKRLDPTTDVGRAKMQQIVDDLAAVFVSAVARNRGVEEAEVLDNYGQGGVMAGQAAVTAGLADRLGSLEGVITELIDQSQSNHRSYFQMATRTGPVRGPINVSNTTELRAALEAGHIAEEISVTTVDVEKIKTDARAAFETEFNGKQEAALAEARAAGVKEGAEKGTAAERARLTGLQAIAVPGFEKEIAAAIKDGATVEATAVAIGQAQKSRGSSVAALREGAPAAVAHGGEGGETKAKGAWGSITARFNKGGKK